MQHRTPPFGFSTARRSGEIHVSSRNFTREITPESNHSWICAFVFSSNDFGTMQSLRRFGMIDGSISSLSSYPGIALNCSRTNLTTC